MAVLLNDLDLQSLSTPFVGIHWPSYLVAAVLSVAVLFLWLRLRRQTAESLRERRMREEMEVYGRLDPAFTLGRTTYEESVEDARVLARRVCSAVAQKSVFSRVAMLLRDAEGKLTCAASAGIDDLTAAALRRWSDQITREEHMGDAIPSLTTGTGRAFGSIRVGQRSFALQLGPSDDFDPQTNAWQSEGHRERRKFRRAIAIPMRGRTGRISGVLVVCGDLSSKDRPVGIDRALAPLEMLTQRLGSAMENLTLSERLLRAEKLAAVGQLAAGVAHALNNPLTAVLGFGELIAETADEARVRKDANTIVIEARRMCDTIQQLIDFWRPGRVVDEAVAVGPLVLEIASRCDATLGQRGVQLVVTVSDGSPAVRGNRERISQVLEQLLNNAAQAVSSGSPPEEGGPHVIRLTLSHDERGVHIIVSDTGPGFREPNRAFDPFYTTRQVGEGSGLGLSICYGIVREHGGEINAFNLYPHGAAVIVDLPVGHAVQVDDSSVLIREVA